MVAASGEDAAKVAATAPVSLTHENTLGMMFHAVPGATVLFSVHETRVTEWEAFIKAGTYQEWSSKLKPHFEQGPDHPVVLVNLKDAIAFCNWLT